MSWMAKLYETYEHIEKRDFQDDEILWPISHFVKKAHVEVVIDYKGNFIKGRTKILHGADSPTLIPASESSAGKAGSKIAPHPLCDEISYCASDYPSAKEKKIKAYMKQLRAWADSKWSHSKIVAILNYLEKGTLWKDLSNEIEFPVKVKNLKGVSQSIAENKVFLRWRVEEPGKPDSATWKDKSLIKAWIKFDQAVNSNEGFCYILGSNTRRASNHPRFLRWPGDGAKLVSSNDHSGFTFRGRFTDSKRTIDLNGAQAVQVSVEVTQKAHNALRWLISRQGYRNGDQVYVAWAVSGQKIPEPLTCSQDLFTNALFFQEPMEKEQNSKFDHTIDLGGSFALQLKKYMAGYRTKFEPNEQIMVMGLDSATPGRMGIIYYRELLASEFLNRLHDWHQQFSWPQRVTKEFVNSDSKKKSVKKVIWPVSSPIPWVIAEAAYGAVLKSNKTLKKSLLERLLPCIVDGQQFPKDIMLSAVRLASNRNSIENWEWQRNLGVTCALFKGYYLRHPDKIKRREYAMALEEKRTTRDYLYGRLLAIAEKIEVVALGIGGENRPTTAARLMQRFADRPFSTWRNIELGLQPYMQRLQASRTGFLVNRKKELDFVQNAFVLDDYTSDKSLTGEFLLGYHCQIQYWRDNKSDNNKDQSNKENNHES